MAEMSEIPFVPRERCVHDRSLDRLVASRQTDTRTMRGDAIQQAFTVNTVTIRAVVDGRQPGLPIER